MLSSDHKRAEILDRIITIGRAVQQHIYENPKIVYELIVESVCEVTRADCAVIYPYHPSFGEFYDIDNVASCGLHHELALEARADKREGLSARVHQQREIIREEIGREEPHLPSASSFITREEVQAFMGLSLRIGDNILGILYVDYREPHVFSEEKKRIIRLFGQQAALAISNSWLSRLASIRGDAVSSLKTVGQSLVAIGDPSESLAGVLEGIARSAQEVMGADLIDLYQYIQARDEFVLPPTLVGERLQDQWIPTRIHRDDVVVAAVRKGEPQYFQDARRTSWLTEEFEVPRDSGPDQRFVIREKIVSSAIIPLMAAGETVGVMFVNYRSSQFFSQEQEDVIETFAAQAAVAIYNSRLFQQVSGQAEALGELNELALRLVSIDDSTQQDTRSLLKQVATSAKEVLRADMIELYEYRQEKKEYRLPHISIGERRGPQVPKEKIYESDAVFHLIQRNRPLYVENVADEVVLSGPYSVKRKGQPKKRYVGREGIASTAVIPLRIGSETVGLMFANYRTAQAFTKEQRQVVELFASQAAIAIHNSRLFNRSLRQRDELEVLNEVGQILTSGIRLRQDEILQMIYEQTRRLMDAGYMLITLYDKTADEYSYGLEMEDGARVQVGQEKRPRDWARKRRTGEIIRTRQLLLHRTEAAARQWYLDTYGTEDAGKISCSFLGVPMIAGERVIGVIAVRDPQKENVFNEYDMQVLSSIASQAAIALDNANLYYRRVQALAALNEVGQVLTSGIRLREDEILELIYEQVRRLTGTEDMYIALYDDATEMIRFGIVMEGGARVEIEPRRADIERKGKTEEVIFTGQFILHKTRQESEYWYTLSGRQEFIDRIQASYMGVPMMIGERVLGMIAVYDWEYDYAYDEQDLHVLSSMASQAAIALDNANLYYEVNQALKRRVQALSVLNEVGQALTSGIRLNEDAILELIYEQARRLTGTENIYIALYDEQTEMITFSLLMEKGEPLDVEQQKGFAPRKINRAELGKTEDVILNQKPILHKTRAEALAWYREPGHREYVGEVSASHLAVPMVIGERAMGVIAIYDWELEGAYDEQDLRVFSSMASQAAVALENARLYAEAREELIAARQLAALGTVTAAIQHRINNTLNIIGPNLTRLRRRVDTSDPTIQEILDIIERNTKYTSDYITRIQEPLKETEVQLIDVNASLREAQVQVWDQYHVRSGFGRVEVVYNLDDSLPLIEASLGQVTEIFRNLMENSYKAMGVDGGTLTILSGRVDDWIEVEIQDTGPGIPSNIRDRLFVKPVPSKEPGAGSGLGLWLTNLLLQKHAGEIIIRNTGADGTTILVRLPISKSQEQV